VKKTLKLYYPFIKMEGLYCLEPSISGKFLRLGDFQCFLDRHIVEVLSDEVVINDLCGFLPLEEYGQEGDWARFYAYEGSNNPLDIEFPSVWTNIHTYRPFKATRRGLRAFESPGSTLSPHNLSERLTNALRAYFFGGFLSFPTWDKNKYITPQGVVKRKKLDVCLHKTTRSDTY
jgi:hypothetical protein